MSFLALALAALVVLPASGVALWAWMAMAQIEDDLLALAASDHIRLET